MDSNLIKSLSNNTLSELLAQQSQLFIKSYGLGNLATPSFRGTGASHTAVLWNGFSLQNLMNGTQDLSLIPVTFSDNIQIQYGGSGGLFGSGAIGGTIQIINSSQFDKGISVGLNNSLGSFSNQQQNINFQISKARFITSTKLFNHAAKNDFPFINSAVLNKPEAKQTNGELSQYGLLHENYFKINDFQKISLRLWYQNNDRNIPPPMTQSISTANQKDEFYRAAAEWQKTGNTISYFLRAAYFHEQLIYTDAVSNINSRYLSRSAITEGESNINIGENHLLNAGINSTYNQAVSGAYLNNPDQSRTSLFSSYKIHNNKNTLNGIITIREEIISNKTNPVTPSAGFEGQIVKGIVLKGKVSKNYRIPTFNDLYWNPGGNPNLIPESGWSEEAGVNYTCVIKKIKTEMNITGYNSYINNWIIWLPGINYWAPENIMEVWSRGLETKLQCTRTIEQVKFQVSGMTNYVLSTNEKTKSENDASLHRQLIYVPMYQALGNFSVNYLPTGDPHSTVGGGKSFFINYNHTYTGYRYTSSDNTEYLPPYQTGNISISCSWKVNVSTVRLYAQVNNLWNEVYQVMSWRAMPMRNYLAGVSISI